MIHKQFRLALTSAILLSLQLATQVVVADPNSEKPADKENADKFVPGATEAFIEALKAQKAGDVDGAIAQIKKAIVLRPNAWNYRLLLAMLLKTKKDYAGVETELVRVEELNPNYGGPNTLRAEIAAEAGETEKAIALYKKALSQTLNDKMRKSVESELRRLQSK